MELNKAYKLRLYPNKKQKQYFEQNFGNARFMYNKMLEDKIEYYKKYKKHSIIGLPSIKKSLSFSNYPIVLLYPMFN